MTTNTMISVSAINTALPTFVDDRLNKATQRIISIYTDAAKYADTKNRELAKIFSDVAEKKSYEKDGFSSVADYANSIFGIKRQNAYALAAAGKIYNTPDAPEELKAMSPSKLAEISSLNRDKVVKAITDGTISKDTTQKDLREFANKVRTEEKSEKSSEVKVRNCPMYNVHVCDIHFNEDTGTVPVMNETILTEDEWDKYFSNHICEASADPESERDIVTVEILPIAPIRDAEGKIIKRRKVYVSPFHSMVVEFTRIDPEKKSKSDPEPSTDTDNT